MKITRRLKKIARWLIYTLCASLMLGAIDCWIAGTNYRDTVFSKTIWMLKDGGTTESVGLGYSITYYRKMQGEHGPEIWYWFLPFTVYHTTERSGVRWIFSSGQRLTEPSYQGLTLSKWLIVYYNGYSGHDNNPPAAEINGAKRAIRAIGTNAIPTLIAWLADDSPGISRREIEEEALKIRGKKGRPAIPALIELLKDKNEETRVQAFFCLQEIQPDKEVFVPVLIQMVHEKNKSISLYAAEQLVGDYPDAAIKAGILEIHPELTGLFEDATNHINIQTNAPK